MSISPTIYYRKFLRWVGADRAISYAIWGKVWQLFAGPITILMIARYLSPENQGFYYTFISLVALQSFVELGFSVIIVQFASHEWSDLKLDSKGNITGDPKAMSRLVSLGRLVFKWHLITAMAFVLTVGIGGFWFLSHETNIGLSWQSPWIAYIILSSLELVVHPMMALLEGCNQVASTYLIRLIQSVAKSLIIWLVLFLGGDLWIAVGVAAINLLVEVVILGGRYQNFFKPFFSLVTVWSVSWKTEIWPLQWRLAIGGFGGYFAQSILTPILFHYHGAVIAGKMGMTLQLTGMIESLGMAWVASKFPRFGMLIAQKEWAKLDHLFFKALINSMSAVITGSLLLFIAVYGLNAMEHPLADRLVSLTTLATLLGATVFLHVVYCNYFYLRAHKKEPLLTLNIIFSLTNGLLVWFLGSRYAALGASLAYLLSKGLILFPFSTIIFFRCREKWHK